MYEATLPSSVLVLFGHKGQDQARHKELLVLNLTWESSKDLQSTDLKLLARLLSMCSQDLYLKLFPGLDPSLFWYKMLRRHDFHEKPLIPKSYSLEDDLEKTSNYKIIPLRKGIDSIVFA